MKTRMMALALLLAASATASAQLNIVRINGGGTAPANAVGGGNLTAIFNAAADVWERAIQDNHTVTITYSWAALGGSTLGVHNLTAEGGTPHRETAGTIRFDNDGSSVFFLDPSPNGNTEWTNFTASTSNYGGGTMNDGRVWTGATGNASGRIDLFSVALHEIGHALGLSSANNAFVAEAGTDRDVDVTSPRPFPGSVIPISASSAHVNVNTALMFPSVSNGIRRLITAADIIANAQISQFTNLNLDPHNSSVSAPADGNLILSSIASGQEGGVYHIDWYGRTASFGTLASGFRTNAVQMGYLNAQAIVADFDNSNLLRFSQFGGASTLNSALPGTTDALDVDQNTQYVCAAGAGIYSVNGSSFTTLSTLNTPNAICRDNESGGYAYTSSSAVYHLSASGSTTTIASLPASGTGICYMNDTNSYAVTMTNGQFRIISRSGTLIRNVDSAGSFTQACCYDDVRRRLFVVNNVGDIQEYSNTGALVRTRSYRGFNWSGIDIWGDHTTNLNTTGQRGTRCFINIRHPDSPSGQYCAAIALDNQPGLGIDSRWQAIAPDVLFFTTVCGGLPFFTSGFAGTLNSAGSATASFTIPFELPLGTMIYAVSSAVNSSYPSNLDLGIPEGILVR